MDYLNKHEQIKKIMLARHNNYHMLLIAMMILLTVGGVMGILLFFETGEVINLIAAAIYVTICISVIVSKTIKSKIIGGD